MPTFSLLIETMHQGGKGNLVVDSVCNIGPHYSRTLREWRSRFLAQFDSVIGPALLEQYPSIKGGPREKEELEIFKRMWIYYYDYCQVGFTTRTLADYIIAFTRPGNASYGCNVFC